jgi:PEP-CTERM motif
VTTTRILFGTMMAACVMGVLSTAVSAAVYSDNFESDTVGVAPVGWTSSNTSKTAGLTLTTAVDSTFGGGSNPTNQVMDANQLAGTGAGAVFASSPFSSAVTLNDGDSISLSFDLHLASTPTALDRKFRFGLYNSASTGTTNPEGYIARLDTGADTATPATATADVWASVGGLGSTTAQGSASLASNSSTATGFQLTSTSDIYNLTLTLKRIGATISDTVSVGLDGGAPVTLTGIDSSSSVLTATGFSFNEILIGQNGGAPLDYHIDNVNVALTAAPEPASLGLLGMGAVALLTRRRKA